MVFHLLYVLPRFMIRVEDGKEGFFTLHKDIVLRNSKPELKRFTNKIITVVIKKERLFTAFSV